MSAESFWDSRESGFVEIEFNDPASAATFIENVNAQQIDFLRGELDETTSGPRAGHAFADAPALEDPWFPRRAAFVAIRVPAARNPDEIAAALRAKRGDLKIRDAAPRPRFVPATPQPTDPRIGVNDQPPPDGQPATQWYLHRCGVLDIWNSGIFGEKVVVADLDWGFDLKHPDLAGRFDADRCYNVPRKNTDVQVGILRHGTGAAGLIGAAANQQGIVGFAPACRLWLIQAGIESDQGPEQSTDCLNDWASAIDHVLCQKSPYRKVINLEVQTGRHYSAESSVAVQGALRRATDADVFVCVPAGNGPHRIDRTEKGCDIPTTGGIVVAATGYGKSENPRSLISNFGTRVLLSAPGEPENDLTCQPGIEEPYTSIYGGTSGASAKVAGALALLLSHIPNLTHERLMQALTAGAVSTSSKPIGKFLDCRELFGAVA